MTVILIIIIIAPISILSEDEWGDLERLYKACQAAIITDGGLFTGVYERSENKQQSEDDNEMKPLARSRGQRTDMSWCKQD